MMMMMIIIIMILYHTMVLPQADPSLCSGGKSSISIKGFWPHSAGGTIFLKLFMISFFYVKIFSLDETHYIFWARLDPKTLQSMNFLTIM